jgi:hypothetical protein
MTKAKSSYVSKGDEQRPENALAQQAAMPDIQRSTVRSEELSLMARELLSIRVAEDNSVRRPDSNSLAQDTIGPSLFWWFGPGL